MNESTKYQVSDREKKEFIDALTIHLGALRAKASIAQEDLSKLIGVSRQTYGAIERGMRRMSWSTYLSLILFYDYNQATHQMIRNLDAFPHKLFDRFNPTPSSGALPSIAAADPAFNDILERLDERALHAINTVIMVEYARCTELPGEAVVKSFNGRQFTPTSLSQQATIHQALSQLNKDK